MDKVIENSKKMIKESATLSRLELEKKKIELEAKMQLFGTTFGIDSRTNYCTL